MSFTFVKIKKEASFQKDVLEEMFEDASEEVQEKVAALPDLGDDNCSELLDALYELIAVLNIPKRTQPVYSEKEQMYCLVSCLLSTQSSKPECLNRFIKWFMDHPEPSIYKVKMYLGCNSAARFCSRASTTQTLRSSS